MIIPFRSDAPLYHRPWGTIGLIAVNVLVFLLNRPGRIGAGAFVEWWVLPFGEGLTPLRWLTSAFAHLGFLHLAGNLVFLWTFGLVVEGKLGWARFLPIYLGMAVGVSACEQLIMWSADGGGSLGASSAIFGLMVIALFWAPMNVMDCLLWFVVIKHFEAPIWAVSLFFVAFDLVDAWWQGFAMATPLLHLLGAAAGVLPALLFLKRGWVDCEGWDLLTFLRHGRPQLRRAGAPPPRPRPAAAPAEPPATPASAIAEVEADLAGGRLAEAMRRIGEARRRWPEWALPAASWQAVVDALVAAGSWKPAASEAALAAAAHPALATAMDLLQARIHIDIERRPIRGSAVLARIVEAGCSPGQAGELMRLRAQAQALRDQGVLEFHD